MDSGLKCTTEDWPWTQNLFQDFVDGTTKQEQRLPWDTKRCAGFCGLSSENVLRTEMMQLRTGLTQNLVQDFVDGTTNREQRLPWDTNH